MALMALLQERAKQDELFAVSLRKEKKSISECVRYIYGELYADAEKNKVGNAGVLGVADSDILAMAVHYYDEDDIEIKPMQAKVKTAVAKTDGKATKTTKTDGKAKPQDSKTEVKKPVKKNPLLEAIKNSAPKPKTESKPKLEVKKEGKTKTETTKKESKKSEDFVGSLFDF